MSAQKAHMQRFINTAKITYATLFFIAAFYKRFLYLYIYIPPHPLFLSPMFSSHVLFLLPNFSSCILFLLHWRWETQALLSCWGCETLSITHLMLCSGIGLVLSQLGFQENPLERFFVLSSSFIHSEPIRVSRKPIFFTHSEPF